METKIELSANDNIESVVYTLLAARARGEHVYCNFGGHELHSSDVSMDSAYMEVVGCTKAEYEKSMKELHNQIKKEEQAQRETREQGYMEKVKASRTEDKKPITLEEVINGLKFIAENRSISHEELVDGLIKLGCNFSLEEIKQQFPEEINLLEGMIKGNISSGAVVIANVRDSENGRAYCNEMFLGLDDATSIYNFIRVTTGDETYTKENIDELSNSRHR